MAEADLDTTIRTWGNSYGIIIPADVARRLHIKPGEPIHVKMTYTPECNDADALPKWRLGTMPDIDAIVDEELGV